VDLIWKRHGQGNNEIFCFPLHDALTRHSGNRFNWRDFSIHRK